MWFLFALILLSVSTGEWQEKILTFPSALHGAIKKKIKKLIFLWIQARLSSLALNVR